MLGRSGHIRKCLSLAEWNVRTLLDREGSKRPERQTALVAKELSRYNIDIAALCETQLLGKDSLVENATQSSGAEKPDMNIENQGWGLQSETLSLIA